MKLQLVMLPQPILVSDEEIETHSYYFSSELSAVVKADYEISMLIEKGDKKRKLVVAGIPELPSIDFSALSEEDCKKIGWVDVEKLAVDLYYTVGNDGINSIESFVKGFKTAQSLNEKEFSEEDVRKAFKEGLSYTTHKTYHDFSEDLFIQSLSQPKIFDVEVEMEIDESIEPISTGNYPHKDDYYYRPKVTNNQIKITKIL